MMPLSLVVYYLVYDVIRTGSTSYEIWNIVGSVPLDSSRSS
jgi:hypothetical protein